MSNLIDLQVNTITVAKDPTTFTDTDAVTKQFVDTQITNLIDTAPGSLDTLNELAAAINDDSSFFQTINSSITAETNARIAADDAITTRINNLTASGANSSSAETALRIAGDNALNTDIDDEVNQRNTSRSAITGRLDSEEATRTADDFALNTRLDDETTARTNADTALDVAKLDKSTKYATRYDDDFAFTDHAYLYIGDSWRLTANNTGDTKKIQFEYSTDGFEWQVGIPFRKTITPPNNILDVFPIGTTPVDMYVGANILGSAIKNVSMSIYQPDRDFIQTPNPTGPVRYPIKIINTVNDTPAGIIEHVFDPTTPTTNNSTLGNIVNTTFFDGNGDQTTSSLSDAGTFQMQYADIGDGAYVIKSSLDGTTPGNFGHNWFVGDSTSPDTLESQNVTQLSGDVQMNEWILTNITMISNRNFKAHVQIQKAESSGRSYIGLNLENTGSDGLAYVYLTDQANAVDVYFNIEDS
jgi:hypothetical protein